jgi:tRNA/rRNA methyltransferase
LDAPIIILSYPQLPQNIGSVARAMKNCGLSDLRLVNPRDGWPNNDARPMAAGADEILEKAKVFKTLVDALKDVSMVIASTARNRDITKLVVSPTDAVRRQMEHIKSGGKCGFLFGAEQSGLTNKEISIANLIVQIPLDKKFSSLNLSQAVLIMSWEWRKRLLKENSSEEGYNLSSKIGHRTPFSNVEEREFFFLRFEKVLDDYSFFATKEMKPSVMNNLKSIFIRADLSKQELATLNGVISAIERKQDYKK